MEVTVSGFDWDDGNWPKCGKHGVSKEEIESFFEGLPMVMTDPNPAEPRMRAIENKARALSVPGIYVPRNQRTNIH
jgi:uncharacterized DUF497 family protein